MSTATPAMVLPALDEHGEVPTGRPWFTNDLRVPGAVDRDHREVRAAADWRTGHEDSRFCQVSGPELTPRMRHLFDVLESAREYEVEPAAGGDDDWRLEERFSARLTCVRCGLVLNWEGTRDSSTAFTVDPTPITAGALVAQQVDSTRYFRHVDSTWSVHLESGERVGVIAWRRGPRGRAFYEGRLRLDPVGEWQDDVVAEGETPEKVLRKLARAYKGLVAA